MVDSTPERNIQSGTLAKIEERYRVLFHSAVYGIVHLHRSGRVLMMNRAAEEIMGRGPDDFSEPLEHAEPSSAIREDGTPLPGIDYPARVALTSGREVHGVVLGIYNRRDRAWRWIEANATPLFSDGHSDADEVYMTFADVTARRHADLQIKQLNEQVETKARALEALNRELETFSYSVSHDFRAPLRSMDGFSRVLLEDYADKLNADGKDSLNRICAAAHRMNLLIDALVGLSRLSREEMHVGPVDLSTLAGIVAEAQRHNATGRTIEFSIAGHLTAVADPRLIQVVLEHLFANAIKFTRTRPVARIEFGVTDHADERVFFVRDNGVGFNSAYAHRLFGAFQHFHSTTEYPGAGIGLATVQRIIHRHGGRVFAESQPDQGATFSFTLPASTPSPQ